MADAPDTAHRRIRFCEECKGPPHTSKVGHRWRTSCDWPLGCDERAFRGVEGRNVFGVEQRHFYCEPHLDAVMSGRAVKDTYALMKRVGISDDITRPDVVAANAALKAHQQTCEACEGVRLWIATEMGAGRIQTVEDRNRAGVYTMEHACEAGIPLFAAVGRAMMA